MKVFFTVLVLVASEPLYFVCLFIIILMLCLPDASLGFLTPPVAFGHFPPPLPILVNVVSDRNSKDTFLLYECRVQP